MRKKSPYIMLSILILSLIAIHGINFGETQTQTLPKVFIYPSTITDETLKIGAPSQDLHPSNYSTNATVTTPEYAYDGNQMTNALINVGANPSMQVYTYFDVAGFNSVFVESYATLEIKMNYSVTTYCRYRMLMWVGASSTLLQDWKSISRPTPYLATWTGVQEPNDGDWSQADLANMRISIETKRTSSATITFKVYEVWVTVLGDAFKVKINISNVQNLYGWQVNMTFNPNVVNTDSAYIYEGPFLKQAGSTLRLLDVNNTAGCLVVAYSLDLPYPPQGATGNGTLVFITFKIRALEAGTLLQFVPKTFLNRVIGDNTYQIERTTEDGVFDNRPSGSNVPPVASFSADPSVANVRDPIKFNASASYDPDAWLVSYRWNYGDGSTIIYMREQLRNINLTAKTAHIYTHPGVYTVTLTITDSDGATATATTSVTIKGHDVAIVGVKTSQIAVMPGISVTIKVTVANKGLPYAETFVVTLYYNQTAVGTQDVTDMPSQTEKILTFEWDTTGVNYGKYVLKANTTVVDEDCDTSNNQYVDGAITISQRNIVDCEAVVGGRTFHVIIESTSSLNQSDFNFNPAGKKISFSVAGQDGTGGFCNVTIPTDLLGGSYTVLFDDLNITSDVQMTTNITHAFLYFTYTHSSHTVTIIGQTVATPPVAVFTISTPQAVAGAQITFNASASFDPDGTIESYQWNFGDQNITTIPSPIITHVYSQHGNKAVTLTVKDNKQLSSSAQASVTIIDYPRASFSYSPSSPLVSTSVTFNATSSEPNDGEIINYKWSFGDGSTATGVTANHAYTIIGNYDVILNVTNSEGLWDTETKTVTVSIHNIAITAMTATPNTVKIGQQISISVTVANKGNFTENFDIATYCEDTKIETKAVTNLAPSAFETKTIVWNTTGISPTAHTLKVVASTVVGETETDDNTIIIENAVTIHKLDSQLSISASPTTLVVKESIIINGTVNPVRQGVVVTIYLRLGGGAWDTLATVTTDGQGQYTYTWSPEKAGIYEAKASWQGDLTTLPDESNTQQITVKEPPTPINFLYVVAIAVVILLLGTAVYFLKIRKPKAK